MENQPPIGRMMALATRYDVSTQVASSMLADRLPAMCGSETLATLVSSTSMKVASITVMAMIHGFTPRTSRSPDRRTLEPYLAYSASICPEAWARSARAWL